MGWFSRAKREEPAPPAPAPRPLHVGDFAILGELPGGDEVLLQVPGSGEVHRLPTAAVDALTNGTGPATEAELAGRLADALPEWSGEDRRALAARLQTLGLTWRHDDGVASTGGRSIERIGIPTRDRPELAARALESVLAACAEWGRRPLLILADASTNRAHLEANASQLARHTSAAGVRALHLGPPEIARALAHLDRAGVDSAASRFAFGVGLDEPGAGQTRNLLLAAAGGHLLFSLDDDTLCRPLVRRDRAEGLVFTSDARPTPMWFHAELEAAQAALAPDTRDPLALHERLLGRSAAELGPAALDRACPALVRRASSGRARVLATMNGLAGDSGMDSALWLVAGAHGETRARLDADASTYALALRSRQVVRLTSTPLVSDAPFFMTGFVGIDVAALPPPFFPCFRGEDGAFAAAMRAAAPWAVTGHLDMALVHAPTPGRGYRALEEAARQTRFAELLALLLAELGLVMGEAGTPAARLRTLGALLAQLAGAARPDFLDVVKGVVVRRVLSMLDHVERVLGSSVCSPHRRRDLETIRDALAGRLERPGLEGPAEFGGTPEGWSAAQRHLARYGHLLTEWPGLLEVAAERGEALFAPA